MCTSAFINTNSNIQYSRVGSNSGRIRSAYGRKPKSCHIQVDYSVRFSEITTMPVDYDLFLPRITSVDSTLFSSGDDSPECQRIERTSVACKNATCTLQLPQQTGAMQIAVLGVEENRLANSSTASYRKKTCKESQNQPTACRTLRKPSVV